MSVLVTPSPSRRGPTALYAVAAVVVCAAVLAVVLGMSRPIDVTIEGVESSIPQGSSVADVADAGLLEAGPGDLVSLEDEVLEEEAGTPPTFLVNGEPADDEQEIFAGDEIASVRGEDVQEKTVTVQLDIPYETRIEGKGPIEVTVSDGKKGTKEVTRGEVSKVVVEEKVLKEPVDVVVKRRRVTSKDKVVALTFDDGPWPTYTQQILNVLKKEKVKATFFMLGTRVNKSPESMKRIVAEGHTPANHSYSHVYLNSKTKPETVRKEISGGRKSVAKYSGKKIVWYRPAGGMIDQRGRNVAKRENQQIVMWDVDSGDWRKPGTAAIVKRVVGSVKPGSIVLMHDGGGDRSQTVKAVGPIVRALKKKGYTFVTLDELGKDLATD